MNYMYLLNLLFAVTILILGVKRYLQTEVKAFLFIGLAYALFGFSHLAVLTDGQECRRYCQESGQPDTFLSS
jgi:hypothetical protein